MAAEAGADVACADINEQSAKSAAAAVEALGRRGLGLRCDVTAEAEVEAMVRRTVEAFGRLDIWGEMRRFGARGSSPGRSPGGWVRPAGYPASVSWTVKPSFSSWPIRRRVWCSLSWREVK